MAGTALTGTALAGAALTGTAATLGTAMTVAATAEVIDGVGDTVPDRLLSSGVAIAMGAQAMAPLSELLPEKLPSLPSPPSLVELSSRSRLRIGITAAIAPLGAAANGGGKHGGACDVAGDSGVSVPFLMRSRTNVAPCASVHSHSGGSGAAPGEI